MAQQQHSGNSDAEALLEEKNILKSPKQQTADEPRLNENKTNIAESNVMKRGRKERKNEKYNIYYFSKAY